jgi:hypothetical protein
MVRIIILLGFVAVMLAMVALLLTDARLGSALACDRPGGNCSLTQRELTRTWNESIPIGAIDRAEVRVRPGRGGSPQVWIVTSAGDYFFADYVLRTKADDAARRINDFLSNTSADARLFLSNDERALYWVAWAFVPVIVLLLIVLARALFGRSTARVRT